MRIIDLLDPRSIGLDRKPSDKQDAIESLVGLMEKSGKVKNKEDYLADVLKREASGTTGVGEEIAIPHAKSSGMKEPGLAAMTVTEGMDFDSLDGEDTKLFFLIGVPENSNDDHLKLLSRLSTMMMDPDFKKNLLEASDPQAFLAVIEETEKARFGQEESKPTDEPTPAGPDSTTKSAYDLVGVTGCPTGIAHTFMAKEGLMNKAKEMGLTMKIETHGSTGIENALTPEDIAGARGVIVAADVSVEKDRFDGKPLVETKVANGINKPEELINRVLSDQTPLYKAKGEGASMETSDRESSSMMSAFYKHLMNGVSHMLPFVVGGGILLAISFLLDDFSIDPASFGTNTPLAAFFNRTGSAAFGFMLPILAGFIAMSIADRPALAVGFVGGYLANTGGAGFLGALLAGFLAGGIILVLRKLTAPIPKTMDGIKPMLLFPVLGILAMSAIMIFLLNPPLAQVNLAISDWLNNLGGSSKILLGLLLGGMMSIDMGGPINKAAYVFGTASLAQGSSPVMAAVMVGGMVPPIALALSMILFKNKYTARDKQSIPSNIIMGLSFITEGAIPFAAADPLRVIPASVAGSAVAGMLSMIFGCSIRAPHGGIWVIGVIDNPLGYLIALVAGSAVACLLLGLLKKDLAQDQ